MNTQEFKQRLLPHEPAMHRVALSLLHHEADAQDAVQEAFLHLWKGRDELDRVLNLQAYCVSMAKRKSVDLLRKKRPEISIQSSEMESEIWNLKTEEEVFPEEEPLQKVLRLLPQLTEAQQQAIRLKYLEGQKPKEVVAPEATINSKVSKPSKPSKMSNISTPSEEEPIPVVIPEEEAAPIELDTPDPDLLYAEALPEPEPAPESDDTVITLTAPTLIARAGSHAPTLIACATPATDTPHSTPNASFSITLFGQTIGDTEADPFARNFFSQR